MCKRHGQPLSPKRECSKHGLCIAHEEEHWFTNVWLHIPLTSFSYPMKPKIMSSHTLALILLVLTLFLQARSTQSDPASERLILESFINQSKTIAGGGHSGLSDWIGLAASTADHCQWPGVTCSASGLITKLDLQSRGLSSPLPTVICNLPSLTQLILSHNSYREAFPIGLFNCTNLSLLDLASNNFN